MIYILCANPAWDRLLILNKLALNEVNRALKVVPTAAGKGINVARAVQTVGGESELLLFKGGAIGEKILVGLQEAGLRYRFWEVAEETRITSVIHEQGPGFHTVINEPGPLVPLNVAQDLYRFLDRALTGDDLIVLSGSLPRGVRIDYYGKIINLAKKRGSRSVLDTSGVYLKEAFLFAPFMVKPNVREAEEVLGFSINSLSDKLKAVAIFQRQGIELVVLSDGSQGLVVGWKDQFWRVYAKEELLSGGYAIGSGDTLVGVLVSTLARKESWQKGIKFATACGLANTFCPGAGVFDLDLAKVIEPKIAMERISVA